MSKAARKARLGCREAKARQCWKIERDKLHRSGRRRASGNHRKNARKKLETPMEAATPCKMETRERFKDLLETVASGTLTHTRKPKCTCIVEAHESTRKRLECTLPRNHEDGQGDGVPKAGPQQAAADPRVRTCVCASTFLLGWHTHGTKGESTSCRGTFWSAWQVPARVSGRHVVRRTTVLTYPGMRPGNWQGQ